MSLLRVDSTWQHKNPIQFNMLSVNCNKVWFPYSLFLSLFAFHCIEGQRTTNGNALEKHQRQEKALVAICFWDRFYSISKTRNSTVLSCWKFKNTDSFRSSRRPATQVQHSYRQAFWKNWSRDKKTRFIHFEHERLNSAFTAVIWSCARSRSRDMPKVGTITSAFEVRRVS